MQLWNRRSIQLLYVRHPKLDACLIAIGLFSSSIIVPAILLSIGAGLYGNHGYWRLMNAINIQLIAGIY